MSTLDPTTPAGVTDAVPRALAEERLRSARRISLLRLCGVSLFFALFLVLGGWLKLPAWTGNLGLFTVYWLITVAVFVAARRLPSIARIASLAIALVDMPMVFLLQWATFPTSPSTSGVAGFTLGIYVLLLVLAGLSLERGAIVFTAAAGAALEVTLQHLADVSVGAMISTVLVLGLTAAAAAHGQRRLVEQVARVQHELHEQQRAELELRRERTERLAALGTLAAGVGHEINTPLTSIIAGLDLLGERLTRGPAIGAAELAALERSLAEATAECRKLLIGFAQLLTVEQRHAFNNATTPLAYALDQATLRLAELARGPSAGAATRPDPEVSGLLEQARTSAERVGAIVRDLKAFARPEEPTSGPADLGRVLTAAINLVSNEIRHRARLTTSLPALPPVAADEGRLGQVFVNLLINAAHAVPEGASQVNEIQVVATLDASGRPAVEIRDTGAGIPPEHLARIFDPFFTTKAVGEGTGLGLSICHGIVRSVGGELSVESRVGHGTTFRVTLPVAPGARAVTPRVPAGPAPAAPIGRARVLVVDDNPGICRTLHAALRDEHDVVTFTSAADAHAFLVSATHIDLVVCDVMMPGMTGIDLYEALAGSHPHLADRMVFITGGAFTPQAQAFLAKTARPCLEKPFDVQRLRRLVREQLDLGPGPDSRA